MNKTNSESNSFFNFSSYTSRHRKEYTALNIFFLFYLLLLSVYVKGQKLDFPPYYFMISDEKASNVNKLHEIGNSLNTHGLIFISSIADIRNPDSLVVGYGVTDIEKAKKYIQSGQFALDRRAVGISDKPATRLIYGLDGGNFEPRSKEILVLTHIVTDYDLWRQKFFPLRNIG